MFSRSILPCISVLAVAAPASAQGVSIATYTYDARGHLLKVTHSGGVNSEVVVDTTNDAVDNRTQRTVTGRSKAKAVIVPLNKLKIIPLP